MGLQGLSNDCGGIIPRLIINVALSLRILKGLLYTFFQNVGLRLPATSVERDNVSFSLLDEYSIGSDLVFPSLSEEVCRSLPLTVYNPGCSDPIECSVCLCDLQRDQEIRKLPDCNHVFHRGCLDQWLTQEQMTCPLCRVSLVQTEVANKQKVLQRELEEEMMLWFSPFQGGLQGLWCQL